METSSLLEAIFCHSASDLQSQAILQYKKLRALLILPAFLMPGEQLQPAQVVLRESLRTGKKIKMAQVASSAATSP
jgi:hypothetical protein